MQLKLGEIKEIPKPKRSYWWERAWVYSIGGNQLATIYKFSSINEKGATRYRYQLNGKTDHSWGIVPQTPPKSENWGDYHSKKDAIKAAKKQIKRNIKFLLQCLKK